MDLAKKDAIKKLMIDHLKKRGWPEAKNPDKIVFEELQNMYNLLRGQRLIPSYFRFEMFKTVAIREFLKAANKRQEKRRVT